MKDNPKLLWYRINALELALRDASVDFEKHGLHMLSDVYLQRMMNDGCELPSIAPSEVSEETTVVKFTPDEVVTTVARPAKWLQETMRVVAPPVPEATRAKPPAPSVEIIEDSWFEKD